MDLKSLQVISRVTEAGKEKEKRAIDDEYTGKRNDLQLFEPHVKVNNLDC